MSSLLAVSAGQKQGTGTATGPLFILALPRSFSSIVCAVMGQHPQMYGFPELHLFTAETVSEWLKLVSRNSFSMEHGLLRSVAQLYAGEQSPRAIRQATAWIMRRKSLTTGMLFKMLADQIEPRIAVEKGPTLVLKTDYMRRAYRQFPNARFLHLVRDPRTYGASVLRLVHEEAVNGDIPRWMLEFLHYPRLDFGPADYHQADALSPQQGWYELNRNVVDFLKQVPAAQQQFVRGEDLLAEPDRVLADLATWLGIDSSASAIEEMKHPERSEYAAFGPPGAENGFDPHFLSSPTLKPPRAGGDKKSPLPPLTALSTPVQHMAAQFGYRD